MKAFFTILIIAILAILAWVFLRTEKAVAPVSEENTEIPASFTYVNSSDDIIIVNSPAPADTVGSNFEISGQARGYWYFEGSFPYEILDSNNEQLVLHFATAQGEWMTTEFVPFSFTASIPADYIGPATVVLHRDNPSDMPENDMSVSFPIIVQ